MGPRKIKYFWIKIILNIRNRIRANRLLLRIIEMPIFTQFFKEP